MHCNEELSTYIESLIGSDFKENAEKLQDLLKYQDDSEVLAGIIFAAFDTL